MVFGRYVFMYGDSLYLPPAKYVEVFASVQDHPLPDPAQMLWSSAPRAAAGSPDVPGTMSRVPPQLPRSDPRLSAAGGPAGDPF